MRQVRHGLGHVEIPRIVDGRLGPQRPLLFEVLLHVGALVRDVQTRLDPIGDHPHAIAEGGGGRPTGDPVGEEQADAR